MRTRLRAVLPATFIALIALAVTAPLVNALTATLFTTSTLDERVRAENDGIRLKTRDRADVHVQEARFAPGDVVDWHNHPGFAVIAVKSGTMTFYDERCRAHHVGPGKAFVESGGPTKSANEGTVEAVSYVTYVVPRGSARIVPTAPPRCSTGEARPGRDGH